MSGASSREVTGSGQGPGEGSRPAAGQESSRERMDERLVVSAYEIAAWLARTPPPRWAWRLFRAGALTAHRFLPGIRATVEANQAQVLGLPAGDPLVRSAAREAFVLYARYWLDTFRGPGMSETEIRRRFDGDGSAIDEALQDGHGCIAVLPHMGNWDVAGQWVSLTCGRVVAVAEELRPKRLSDLFLRLREELGMRIVPLTDGHVGQQLARLLKENWVVALVADRDLTGRGIEVEMFGRSRRVPAGPALLSIKSGAPLLVCPVYTTDDGWSMTVRRVAFQPSGLVKADVIELTRLMVREFELAIAAKPTDWHMFQPAWEP